MGLFVMDGAEAYKRSARNKHARWTAITTDQEHGIGSSFFAPSLTPKFSLSRDARVFALGSCFAQEVQNALSAIGVNVSSLVYNSAENEPYFMQTVDGGERRHWPMHFFHRYTPPSLLQEIGNLLGDDRYRIIDQLITHDASGQFIDLHYHPGFQLQSIDAIIERRGYVRGILSGARTCDLFIITLGLIEAWLDRETGLYANVPFPYGLSIKERGRYEFSVLSMRETSYFIATAVEMLKSYNPSIRVVLTVSPIPLDATFTSDDVCIATTRSKSTLVAVANEISHNYDFVDYFPSYEIVTSSARSAAWREDNRHIKAEFVKGIMELFCSTYF